MNKTPRQAAADYVDVSLDDMQKRIEQIKRDVGNFPELRELEQKLLECREIATRMAISRPEVVQFPQAQVDGA